MPKYISRNQFEQMKVLKRRKSSNKAIAEALGMSPATVSRNLRYNSYEDYLVSMYGRNSKSQKEVEAKSGPVRIVSSGKKTCKKCGKTKPLEEFDKARDNRDGRSGTCKECRRERQRKQYRSAAHDSDDLKEYGHVAVYPSTFPSLGCWEPVYKHDEYDDKGEDKGEDDDDEIKVNECVYVDINDKVKRGVVIAINNVNYTSEYIVRLDTWFFRKEVKVNQYHIFRREEA